MILKNMYVQIGAAWLVLAGLAACAVPYDEEAARVQREAGQLKAGAEKVAACRQTACKTLDLDGTHLADFTVLNDMPHVTKLMASYTNFDDLGDIAGMSQLTELHISWTSVADLTELTAFPSLVLLHVNNLNAEPDYTPVYRISGLKELSIDARPEDGIGFLNQMPKLETLYFQSGKIDDLTPLISNRNIRRLSLDVALPLDQTPLTKIPNLNFLNPGFREIDETVRETLEMRGVEVEQTLLIAC